MPRLTALAALLAFTLSAGAAMAQNLTPLPSPIMTGDHMMRISRVVGAAVYDDHNARIGTVEDVLTSADTKAAFAVVKADAYMGAPKLVLFPLADLTAERDHVVIVTSKPKVTDMQSYSFK